MLPIIPTQKSNRAKRALSCGTKNVALKANNKFDVLR